MAEIANASAGSTAAVAPAPVAKTGLFDPLGFAARAVEKLLKWNPEAEVAHGRVAMLAVVRF